MSMTHLTERIQSILSPLLAAHDRKVAREIDAGCCGTSRDYRIAREALEAFCTAEETAEGALAALVTEAVRDARRVAPLFLNKEA
jgi:hypothetical protein